MTNTLIGAEVFSLREYPKIGPTFNYSPNDADIMSDASVAHYYFDMLLDVFFQAYEGNGKCCVSFGVGNTN